MPREVEVVRPEVLHPDVEQRQVSPRVQPLRRPVGRHGLVALVRGRERVPERDPGLRAARVETRGASEVSLRRLHPSAEAVVAAHGEPGGGGARARVDEAVGFVEEVALPRQIGETRDADEEGAVAEGVETVGGGAEGVRLGDAVAGVGAEGGGDEDLRGVAEAVDRAEAVEGGVDVRSVVGGVDTGGRVGVGEGGVVGLYRGLGEGEAVPDHDGAVLRRFVGIDDGRERSRHGLVLEKGMRGPGAARPRPVLRGPPVSEVQCAACATQPRDVKVP
mmetsp:Transcript_14234/g.28402  ORF Transcript_14234/g.28402 Transcript_14234/m.28402 type:complete len:276 (-) Transcript_14234:372-1199(-)